MGYDAWQASRRTRLTAGGLTIDIDDLQRALASTDRAAYLVTPRLLRRVIKRDRGLVFLGRVAARQSTYVIQGDRLQAIVSPADVPGAASRGPWPGTVLLIEWPRPDEFTEKPASVHLVGAWRRLFRARVQVAIRDRLVRDTASGVALDGRITRVGRVEFEEARLVFEQDGWLLPPGTDEDIYVLFASHFLELAYFAPALLHPTFPAVDDPKAAEAVFSSDVDALALCKATRLPGSPDPDTVAPAVLPEHGEAMVFEEVDESADVESTEPIEPEVPHDGTLAGRARVQDAKGNMVRSALLWTEAALEAEHEPGAGSRQWLDARSEVRRLMRRLQNALGFSQREVVTWTEALVPLLPRAARDFWTSEARLLSDLQHVCLDHEREVYRLDLLGWLTSLGRRPLKQPLPHLRDVRIANRLRSAQNRLAQVRVGRDERVRLEGLFHPAVRRAENTLRERFQSSVTSALKSTWIEPTSLPERIAFSKLVEELLDQVVRRGHLTLGDLRDAASRSNLKLPDLSGPREFWRGGRLLEADHALAEKLHGVHRRGEFHLRWMQRFSMLAFATPFGRAFTLLGALPFGAAYVILEGLQHFIAFSGAHLKLVNGWSLLALGTLLLGVINYVRFRRQFFATVRGVARQIRSICVDLPAQLLEISGILHLFRSAVLRWFWRYGAKPALFAVPGWAVARLLGAGSRESLLAGGGVFAGVNFLLNTRAGQVVEEAAIDFVGRAWRDFITDILPGAFRLVMAMFRGLIEGVERLIYAVDEWLLFRSGQSKAVLIAKALFNPIWAALAYVVRVVLSVLVEPQINPIKHFPVVTVSHKLILPLTPHFIALLKPVLGAVYAAPVATLVVASLPGAIGFLVWELMSNWRMYAANRPKTLGPVAIGSHGETVVRMLRPGFHSGTLPKVLGRLRRARRRVWLGVGKARPEKAALRQREALHHVEEAFRRFVERDLLALLSGSRAMAGPRSRIALATMHLATNRVRLELLPPGGGDGESLHVDIEERGRWLVAGVSAPGWLDTLSAAQRRAFDDALTGWFLACGVGLVQTPGDPVGFEMPIPGTTSDFPRTIPVRLADQEVGWDDWVRLWNADEAAQRDDRPLVGPAGVLPWCGSGEVPTNGSDPL